MKQNNLLKNPHTFFYLLLISIIFYISNNKTPVIVNPNGFVKDVAFNYSITKEGVIFFTDAQGNEIARSERPEVKNFHTISISIEGNKSNDGYVFQGLIDSIISPAYAAKLFKIRTNIDGQITCRWYNDYSPC